MTTGAPWLFITTLRFLHRDRAFVARLDARLLGATLRRAADVEGAHRQLRARLADRLRGDHADRLADVHRRAARQVAAVAMAADADARFAGQHGADLHRLDTGRLDLVRLVLLDQRVVRHEHRVGDRIEHILRRGAAQDTLRTAKTRPRRRPSPRAPSGRARCRSLPRR